MSRLWYLARAGLLILLVANFGSPAAAETVLIRGRSGEIGHGWLFGSTGIHAGECWIATPAHVVTSPETHILEPFYFSDRNGVEGQSAVPISASLENPVSRSEKDASDLAFARVAIGRKDGLCLSRLGAPTFVYTNLLASAPRVTVFSMLKTSYGAFEAAITGAGVDSYAGATLDLRITSEQDATFLQKGLSGATIVGQNSGNTVPVAMVIRVSEDQKTMRALRFDYIRERFAAIDVDDAAKRRETRSETIGIPYRILGYLALELADSDGPSVLQTEKGCWRVAASGGQSSVELRIELADPLDRVATVELLHRRDCLGGRRSFWVEQRASDEENWTFVGRCESRDENSPPCRVDLKGPRQLRIRIDAKGPMNFSGLLLR